MTHIPGTHGLSQLGYVVPDLHAAIAAFQGTFGLQALTIVEDMPMTECTYLGRPAQFRQHMAFAMLGTLQIEWIEPIAGQSTYTEFLATHPAGGLQHLGLIAEDFEVATADLVAKGLPIVQSARAGDIRVAYFDTRASTGTWTEIIWLTEDARRRFIPGT